MWVQWFLGGSVARTSLSNYGKQLFSFFKLIEYFSINVAALSTFKRHVPACQTPISVSAVSILTVLGPQKD